MKKAGIHGVFRFGLFMLFSACGGPADRSSGQPADSLITIAPSFIIGEDSFEGDYAFGAISDAEYFRDGRIAVLDRIQCRASVFSGTGSFLYSMGCRGDGPGEFNNPDCMVCMGDSLVIFDRRAGRVSVFGPSGEYLGELTTAANTTAIPTYCRYTGNGIIGGTTSVDPGDGSVQNLVYLVSIYDMELNPVDTLHANHFASTPDDISQTIQNTYFSCSFAADPFGNTFVAPVSTDDYLVIGIDADRDTLLTIRRNFPRIEKTREELAEEARRFSSVLMARNPGLIVEYEPVEFRYMIPPNGLHVDSSRRIWVLRGAGGEPVFDVYGYDGEKLFSTRITGIDPEETGGLLWWMVSDHGLMAFSLDPVDFPKVYVFDLPDLTPAGNCENPTE